MQGDARKAWKEPARLILPQGPQDRQRMPSITSRTKKRYSA